MTILENAAAVHSTRLDGERIRLITALGTPLTQDEGLHEEGLAAHVAEQWSAGVDGLLVAGTMGVLQLLRDDTYAQLVRRCLHLTNGAAELLVGAGDCGLSRTLDRIEFLNTQKIDGVVVLAPYFFTFGQDELIEYYRTLADAARAPLYLYDLPQRTRCKMELATVLELAKHPNIRGIKCSDEPSYARDLRDALEAQGIDIGERFRVIIAQSAMVDVFIRSGFREHVDGMFALAPRTTVAIARHAQRGEWEAAERCQRQLNALRHLIVRYGVFASMTAILNARSISGSFAPRPFKSLDPAAREAFLAEVSAIGLPDALTIK
jgi:4-hydroxy-tetrahydrodipicolinate synthase